MAKLNNINSVMNKLRSVETCSPLITPSILKLFGVINTSFTPLNMPNTSPHMEASEPK